MILAFPPCTHLAVSGARHFQKKFEDGRQLLGLWFFCQFINADCEKICIENPVNIISGRYVEEHFPYQSKKYGLPLKPTQTVSPHMFGSPIRKKTNYWLKGLPNLQPTEIVEPDLVEYTYADGHKTTYSVNFCRGCGSHSGKQRSKTSPEIAKAMADQWG